MAVVRLSAYYQRLRLDKGPTGKAFGGWVFLPRGGGAPARLDRFYSYIS